MPTSSPPDEAPAWPGIDDTDLAIIYELQRDGRASLLGISRALRVPVNTVRQRYERLVADGYVHAVALIDPAIVGRTVVGFIQLEVDRELDEVERRLAALPEISWLAIGLDYRSVYLQVSTSSNAELTGIVNQHLRSMPQVSGVAVNIHLRSWSPVFRFSGAKPPPDVTSADLLWRSGTGDVRELDDIDAELVACLAEDARTTVTAMTDRTGLSVPATRQRLVKLLRDRAVRIRSRPNPLCSWISTSRITVEVTGDSTAVAEQLVRMPNVTYVSETTGERALGVELVCATEEQLRVGFERLAAISGLRRPVLARYARVRVHSGRW